MAHALKGVRLSAVGCAILLSLGSGSGYAQDETPRYELYGGYAFLRDLGDPGTNLPVGWSASFAWNPARSLGFVLDVGGNYKSEAGIEFNQHALLAGLRYSLRGPRVTPYFEALGGVIRGSGSGQGGSVTETDFAVQGGAGLGFYFGERLSIRAGVDYRNIFSQGDSFQQFRVVAGLSYGFGGRSSAPRAETPPRTQFPAYTSAVEPPPPPPQPAVAPERTPPVVASEQSQRLRPADALGRARGLLNSGDYVRASEAYRDHLRIQASFKYTIAVGLFCDATNVAQLVRDAGGAEELIVLSMPRRGQGCYGMYWGLYDTRSAAEQAMGTVPAALRTGGQAALPVSQIMR
jgi:hypothetical protein